MTDVDIYDGSDDDMRADIYDDDHGIERPFEPAEGGDEQLFATPVLLPPVNGAD